MGIVRLPTVQVFGLFDQLHYLDAMTKIYPLESAL